MTTLFDIDPSKWMEQDDKAEAEAWDMVLSEVPKLSKMEEETRDALKTVFSLGFNSGVRHQGERLKTVLEVIKNKIAEREGKA